MSGTVHTDLKTIIRKARIARTLTQQELADQTGISLRTVQRIETGEVIPRAYTIRTLTTFLGVEENTADSFGGKHSSAGLRDEALHPAYGVTMTHTGFVLARKWIMTVSSGVLLVMAAIAFTAQSPLDTDFETILLCMVVLAVYTAVLMRIWRTKRAASGTFRT